MPLVSPFTSGGIESALSALINSSSTSTGSAAEEDRVPFVFRSKLRDHYLRGLNLGITGSVEDSTNQMEKAMPAIALAINPHTIEFDPGQSRYTKQDVQNGSVFHHFVDDHGQSNEIITIKFRGSTGDICRLTHRTEEMQKKARERLQIIHNLFQMTREPKILLPGGVPNEFYIDYVSPLFPVVVTFKGFYSRPLTFSETGKKTFSREYSMDFIVTGTNPGLNELVSKIFDEVTQQAIVVDPQARNLGS